MLNVCFWSFIFLRKTCIKFLIYTISNNSLVGWLLRIKGSITRRWTIFNLISELLVITSNSAPSFYTIKAEIRRDNLLRNRVFKSLDKRVDMINPYLSSTLSIQPCLLLIYHRIIFPPCAKSSSRMRPKLRIHLS